LIVSRISATSSTDRAVVDPAPYAEQNFVTLCCDTRRRLGPANTPLCAKADGRRWAEPIFCGAPHANHLHSAPGSVRQPITLAVTSATRSEVLPDIPTVGDFVAGYEGTGWQGVGAPRNTPAEIIDKLNKAINAGLVDPRMKASMKAAKLA